LRGDLDTIVMKAIRFEPEQRYASAEEFSQDIERHLSGLPIKARKPTLSTAAGSSSIGTLSRWLRPRSYSL